jgi:hypothetical protein
MRSRSFWVPTLVLALALVVAKWGSSDSAETTTQPIAQDAFETLESLVGEWRGTQQWTGAIQGEPGPVIANYSSTGNGSAIIENLGTGIEIWMTTVYFVEDDALRADHYCTENQPRLEADQVGAAHLGFELTGISNLDTADEGHVRRIELRRHSDDRLTLVFHYLKGSEESRWSLELERTGDEQRN